MSPTQPPAPALKQCRNMTHTPGTSDVTQGLKPVVIYCYTSASSQSTSLYFPAVFVMLVCLLFIYLFGTLLSVTIVRNTLSGAQTIQERESTLCNIMHYSLLRLHPIQQS